MEHDLARRIRVVVVDDEAAIGELVAEAAKLAGLDCTVTDGVDAFHKALGSDVVGVLVDLMMPGTDGIEILRQLAAKGFGASVVLLSGFDQGVLKAASEVATSLGLRVAGRLSKPFRLQSLIDLLIEIRDAAPPSEQASRSPTSIEDIRAALDRHDFELYYQPQLHLRTGALSGLEALVRLRHPIHGIVAPGLFLTELIECGWMDSLNKIVLPRAIREFGQLRLPEQSTLSVNIIAASLGDLELPDWLAALAREHSVASDRLVVEVTETGLIGNLGTALDVLSRLRIKGIGISVDDFGTGYSSMAQLRTIPATELKIDAIFVKELQTDAASRAMVSKTIQLGHEMGLRVVAEGNETLGQTNILIKQGCDISQGYYFSKPLPFEHLQRWIDDHPRINFQNPT